MVAAARLAVVDGAMTAAGVEEWETYEFDTYEAARIILATVTNGPQNPVSRYYERQLSLWSKYHQALQDGEDVDFDSQGIPRPRDDD
eukprot:6326700-Pyramimonas_sp.AAC.1